VFFDRLHDCFCQLRVARVEHVVGLLLITCLLLLLFKQGESILGTVLNHSLERAGCNLIRIQACVPEFLHHLSVALSEERLIEQQVEICLFWPIKSIVLEKHLLLFAQVKAFGVTLFQILIC